MNSKTTNYISATQANKFYWIDRLEQKYILDLLEI